MLCVHLTILTGVDVLFQDVDVVCTVLHVDDVFDLLAFDDPDSLLSNSTCLDMVQRPPPVSNEWQECGP